MWGKVGRPRFWGGVVLHRFEDLRWCPTGIVLEEDCGTLVFSRDRFDLVRSEGFGMPPFIDYPRSVSWSEGWPQLLLPLLHYETCFGHDRRQALRGLPIPEEWRAVWWVEIGSRVPTRLYTLLDEPQPDTSTSRTSQGDPLEC